MSTEITINQDQIDINVTSEIITIESPQGGYPLPNNVYSVFGRVGNVVAEDGDYNLTQLGDVTITNPLTGQALVYNGSEWVNNTETYVGTVTSVNMTVPSGLTISGNPITTAGTLALGLASGYSIPTTASQSTWDTAYNRSLTSASVTGTTTKTLTLNEQGGGTITATWSDYDTAPVTSVFGRTGAITAQAGDYNTLQVTENTNLYFTNQRARYAISGDATSGVVYQNTTGIIALDDIPNTSLLHDSITVNGYLTPLGGTVTLTTTDVAEGTNLYYTQARFNSAFAAKSTTDLAEGTNLYFTTARAAAAISGTAPITVASGNVSISQSGASTNGYLSSTDWNTFNAKQAALTFGNLTSSDITVTGGSGAVIGSGSTLTLATVNSNVGTYGSSTAIPVITVNGKGLVTAVTTDAVFIPSGALSFIGDVTGTGNTGSDTTLTLATVNSNVGSYGDSTHVPSFTVNAKGLVTAASQTAIPTASSSVTGLLTSTDWATFNAKQAQLNGTGFVKVSGTTVSYDNSTYLTTIEGIAAGGELSGTYASPSLVNSAVTGKVLTGLNITGGNVVDTDSILTAFGKVQNQINGLIGGSIYQGTWNASTNTPTITSGVGTKGYYYIVSVAGSTNIDGITDWNVGDWIIYDGTSWQQVDNTDAVVSVNGYTGAVNLTTSDITEGTNLYYTDARARGSVSAGTGISYNSTTGVITNSAPDQTVSLTASTGISTSGSYPNFTITNTAPDQVVSLTGSTGISTSGTYPNFTITNTAPDQVVSLTGAGTTSISGSYPNFTITSNDQYVGTVTSVGITSSAAALTISSSPITTSGNIGVNFSGTSSQYVAGDGSLISFPSLTGYVPYTGATSNVNLGEYGILTGYVGLDLTPTSTPTTVGTISWDTTYLTPKVVTGTGATTLQIGQEEVILVHNNTGAALTDGQVVYVTGSTGELPSVSLADASLESTSAATIGVVTESIANGANGFVTISGIVHGLNTLAFNEGDMIWLSETAGEYTNVKPTSPAHLVLIGYVIKKSGGNGSILVKIQNTQELEECSDVLFTSLANNDILQYKSATGLWVNSPGTTSSIAEGSNLYYTDARSRSAISLTTTGNNGASTYNSTTGVLNVPTYTLAGLGGINLTSLSATSPLLYNNTTGVFSIQQSSGSQAGYLSAADWTTFNSKQGAITLTTTGSSGAATFSAGTLNIPNYTLSGLGGVPTTRTITINGTTQDLSANQSWTIPTAVNATNTQDFTATAGQTTFTVSGGYTVGQLAVFYNGSKLAAAEYTATNGTTFVLATACQANDIVSAVVAVTGGGIGGSGTTNYISKWTASGVLGNSLLYDNGTNVLIGTTTDKTGAITGSGTGMTIAGSLAPTIAFWDTTDTSYVGFIGQYDNDLMTGTNASGSYRIFTSATERMRVTAAGTVGIGTTNPSTGQLQIVHASGNTLSLQKTSGAASIMFGSDTTNFAFFETINNGGLYISTGNGSLSERIRVTGDGYVRLSAASGGIQFGGNTSANNALNVYETGDFTLVIDSVSANITINSTTFAKYTRVGSIVHVDFAVNVTVTAPGKRYFVFRLPINFSSTSGYNATGLVHNYDLGSSTTGSANVGVSLRNTSGNTYQQYAEAIFTSSGTTSMGVSITYKA